MTPTTSSAVEIPDTCIWKTLELSTGHLEEQVARDLSANVLQLPTSVKKDEYGFMVYVLSDGDRDVEYPACMRQHLTLARAAGCSYLSYDRDAGILEGVASYDW